MATRRDLLAAMRLLSVTLSFAIALLFAGLATPGDAGEYSFDNRPAVTFPKSDTVRVSPYPAGKRAASVWDSDACWRGCTSDCNWRMEACLRETDADACRPHLDACDRACQRACRSRGGPLLGFIDF
jgi:hypothetical protein